MHMGLKWRHRTVSAVSLAMERHILGVFEWMLATVSANRDMTGKTVTLPCHR